MRIVPHRTTAAPEILIDADFGASVMAARKAAEATAVEISPSPSELIS